MEENPTTENEASESLPEKVNLLRQKLGQKAKEEPKFRFYALYDRIYRKDVLFAAWTQVRRNGGSAGIDGIGIPEMSANIEAELERLHQQLRKKEVQAQRSKKGMDTQSEWQAATVRNSNSAGSDSADSNDADTGADL